MGEHVMSGPRKDSTASSRLSFRRKSKDRLRPQVVDIHAAADFHALGEQPGVTRQEGFVLIKIGDFALRLQVPRLAVDETRHGVDHGIEVGIGQYVLDDE